MVEEFSLERNTRRVLALFQETMGLAPVGSKPEPPAATAEGARREVSN